MATQTLVGVSEGGRQECGTKEGRAQTKHGARGSSRCSCASVRGDTPRPAARRRPACSLAQRRHPGGAPGTSAPPVRGRRRDGKG